MAEKRYKNEHSATRSFRNVKLDGKVLTAEEVTKFIITKWKVRPKTGEHIKVISKDVTRVEKKSIEIPLVPITKEKLSINRKKGNLGFVLKEDDNYYYADISKDMLLSLSAFLEDDICMVGNRKCKGYTEGTCPKVNNYNKGIETFAFIIRGYQEINTDNKYSFVVLECENYKKAE